MTGPMSIALFHHAGLAMASYAQDYESSDEIPFTLNLALTYRALVAMTVRLLSWMICFIFCTHRRYRSMYPTDTTFPLSMRLWVTSLADCTVPVPTG